MADDEDIFKERIDKAQDKLGGKKAKARARFSGMADRIETAGPSPHDELREKLNRIRHYVKSTENVE